VNRQLGATSLSLEGQAFGALHALERAGDRIRLAAEHFQLGARLVVVGGIFRAAQAGIRQAAEVIAPRVAAAARDGGREQLVSAAIVAGEIGVDALPVQVIEQRVLREADRPAQGQQHGGTRQCEFPEHDNDTP